MPDMKLTPLHIVFCENGSIYADRSHYLGVFANEFHADELLEVLKTRGGDWCRCKKHTKVTYVPALEGECKRSCDGQPWCETHERSIDACLSLISWKKS